MISIKSQREIDLMKEAGRIVAKAHELVKSMIKPGISTLEINDAVEKLILECDAIPSFKGYGGFPSSICASVNEVVIHGFPKGNAILREGDIIAVDIGACYKGYHGDSAWTYAVGNISEQDKLLMDVTEQSLYEGLKFAKPGNHLTDISHAIGKYASSYGFGIVEDFTGHGIGRNLHEDPAIPNFGESGHGPILKVGMTIAVEPMINAGTKRVKVLSDNWTTVTCDRKKSAHYEHTIVITEDGYEILTKL